MKIFKSFGLVLWCFTMVSCNYKTQKTKEYTENEVQEVIKYINAKDSLSLRDKLNENDVNTFDSTGVNLLTHAVMTGDLNIVKIIADKGADPNLKNKTTMGSTPLMMASGFESNEIAKYLINKGAEIDIQDNNGDPAINWSAYYGNVSFTKLMLDKGAETSLKSIHSDNVMQVALKEWQDSIVELLLERGVTIYTVKKNSIELINAVKNNNLVLTRSLLNKSNVDTRDGAGNTLLMIAADKGYAEMVDYLVHSGANLDAMNSVGQTALNKAIFFGKNSIAKNLIEEKADVNKTDSRFILPPLVAAIRSNNIEMGKILLDKGADINIKDGTNNFSPIMWAALYQNMDFVSTLLHYKPDLSIISEYGTTVFEMTEDKEILKLLKQE